LTVKMAQDNKQITTQLLSAMPSADAIYEKAKTLPEKEPTRELKRPRKRKSAPLVAFENAGRLFKDVMGEMNKRHKVIFEMQQEIGKAELTAAQNTYKAAFFKSICPKVTADILSAPLSLEMLQASSSGSSSSSLSSASSTPAADPNMASSSSAAPVDDPNGIAAMDTSDGLEEKKSEKKARPLRGKMRLMALAALAKDDLCHSHKAKSAHECLWCKEQIRVGQNTVRSVACEDGQRTPAQLEDHCIHEKCVMTQLMRYFEQLSLHPSQRTASWLNGRCCVHPHCKMPYFDDSGEANILSQIDQV